MCTQTCACPCRVLFSLRSGVHFCELLLHLKGEWAGNTQSFFCLLFTVHWTVPVNVTKRALLRQEGWGEKWQGPRSLREGTRISHHKLCKTWRTLDPSACVQGVEMIRSYYGHQRYRTTLKAFTFLCGLKDASHLSVKWKNQIGNSLLSDTHDAGTLKSDFSYGDLQFLWKATHLTVFFWDGVLCCHQDLGLMWCNIYNSVIHPCSKQGGKYTSVAAFYSTVIQSTSTTGSVNDFSHLLVEQHLCLILAEQTCAQQFQAQKLSE